MPGVWNEVKELKSHLAVAGQVSKAAVTASGVTLLELMKMGAMTGLSIGFRPTEVKLDEKKKLREISKVELREISIVDEPGNGPSRITDIKSERQIEAGLRSLGFSRIEAKAFMSEGLTALFGATVDDEEAAEETETEPEAKAEPVSAPAPSVVVVEEAFSARLRKTLQDSSGTLEEKARRDAEASHIVKSMSDLAKALRAG
jgi:hypothetical protein